MWVLCRRRSCILLSHGEDAVRVPGDSQFSPRTVDLEDGCLFSVREGKDVNGLIEWAGGVAAEERLCTGQRGPYILPYFFPRCCNRCGP